MTPRRPRGGAQASSASGLRYGRSVQTPELAGDGAASLHDTLRGLLALRRDVELAELVWMSAAGRSESPQASSDLKETVAQAVAVGLDAATFSTALLSDFNVADGGETGSVVAGLIQGRIDEVCGELGGVPATIEKARDWVRAVTRDHSHEDTDYEAYVALADELDPAVVDRIASDWRRAWQEHRNRGRDRLAASEVFWVSRDHEDLFDDVAHYRFFERFTLGEFDTLFVDLERRLGASLLDLAGSLDPFGTVPGPDPHARNAAQAIWLVSRSRRLPVVLVDVVGLVLRGLSHAASPDGSWPSPIETGEGPGRYLPDTVATAAACITVFKLSTSDAQQTQAARGVDWLLQNQAADGHWPPYGPDPLQGDAVLGTALALEAILRSGRANVERAAARAAEWLIDAQHPAGGWRERSLPNPLLTVVVLGALDLWQSDPQPLAEPLVLARDLLRRSERLALEDSAEARQLAVVAAHAGIETFLYAVLEQPQINVRTMEGSKTIGLRAALTKLQTHYQDHGLLDRGAVLPHRQGVDRLAYVRDEVVHKALRVGRSDIDAPLDVARRFASAVALQVLGHDLLQG